MTEEATRLLLAVANETVIATPPDGQSNWRARDRRTRAEPGADVPRSGVGPLALPIDTVVNGSSGSRSEVPQPPVRRVARQATDSFCANGPGLPTGPIPLADAFPAWDAPRMGTSPPDGGPTLRGCGHQQR